GRAAPGAPRAGTLLIHAWPDRVAKARGAFGRFVLANGRGGMLAPDEPLAGAAFLVVADLQGRAENARIASAAVVEEEEIVAALGDRIEETVETLFDRDKAAVRQRRVKRLGALVLGAQALPPPTGADADRAILDAVRAHGLSILPWDKETDALRARLFWLRQAKGEPWPQMSDEALTERLEDWLLPFLSGESTLTRVKPGALREGLISLVPYEFQRRLSSMAPTHYDAPSGSRVPIRYEEDGPVLAIRVQELFGLKAHPTVADGIPLKLELLSPAHRPIQTTLDLPGFWTGSWADVRTDMRGRYPKHVWPEDPANAVATHRAKPRGK
ncbi:ATP-dependent helicase C-terminal domain-containing protein, partial [Nitratireductor sp. ZSWI3]|uniref:ATP-dependent helicase C-terminal domain-containing protein n=1 Tax=Nitratireductor sp. ZSWI3 TaxID=2966359 RepID=UPI0027E23961